MVGCGTVAGLLQTPNNILFIRQSSLGDVLFTLPAVNAIRAQFPESHIHYLVKRRCAFLLPGFRAVERVVEIDREWYRFGNWRGLWRGTIGLIRQLRHGRYDLVIDLHGLGETGWLARLSGARQRWGCPLDRASQWAYTTSVPFQWGEHSIDRFLRLLTQAGLPPRPVENRFQLPEDKILAARRWLAEAQVAPGERLLFIQPFTSDRARNWPVPNLLTVAEYWREQGVRVIFGGSREERAKLGAVQERGFLLSAGAGFMIEAALMREAGVVLGGDPD